MSDESIKPNTLRVRLLVGSAIIMAALLMIAATIYLGFPLLDYVIQYWRN